MRKNSLKRCHLLRAKEVLGPIANGLPQQIFLLLHNAHCLVPSRGIPILCNTRLTDDLLSRLRQNLKKLRRLTFTQISALLI